MTTTVSTIINYFYSNLCNVFVVLTGMGVQDAVSANLVFDKWKTKASQP